jgi:hypothetical protein
MMQTVGEPEAIEKFAYAPASGPSADTSRHEARQHGVLEHSEFGEQVIELKHESHSSCSVAVERSCRTLCERTPLIPNITAACVRPIQSAEQM